MMNSTARRSGAEPANQRGRSLTAGYAVKRLSVSLSPRDRRESGRAVPRGAHRARSALSASTRESTVATRAAREGLGVLGRNGEAPSDRSLGASVYRPSPSVGDERKMAPLATLLANLLRGSSWDRFADSQRPGKPLALRIQGVTRGCWDTFADSQRPATTAGPLVACPRLESSKGPRPSSRVVPASWAVASPPTSATSAPTVAPVALGGRACAVGSGGQERAPVGGAGLRRARTWVRGCFVAFSLNAIRLAERA